MSNLCRKFIRNLIITGRCYSIQKSSIPTQVLFTEIGKTSSFKESVSTAKKFHCSSQLQTSLQEPQKSDSSENSEAQQQNDLDERVIKYAELAVDLETKKKILMILMEHEVAKLEGKKVPSKITVVDMKELLTMYSFSSRVKYMGFLFEKEFRKASDIRKKVKRKQDRELWLIEKENIKPPEHIQYGIGHNTMVLRVRRKSLMQFYNQRLTNSVLDGQRFVVDMDYDCFMRKMDCNNCGEQLLELYGVNRRSPSPYDLHFCNVDRHSATMAAVSRYMPNLYSPDNFISLTDLSYTDIFPKEKLIYITPYAKDPLKKYDHSAIYIIGGLVDKCIKEPVVLAKAKREGIPAVHLPYDEYLMWGRGNKSLPLNIILDILLTMKNTNDWNKAFKRVPQRKLVRSLDLFSEF